MTMMFVFVVTRALHILNLLKSTAFSIILNSLEKSCFHALVCLLFFPHRKISSCSNTQHALETLEFIRKPTFLWHVRTLFEVPHC